jgi:hypothetical protein
MAYTPTEEDIKHYLGLLKTNRKALAVNLGKSQIYGASDVPTHLVLDTQERRKEIARLKKQLREWNHPVEDHPDDDEPPIDTSLPSVLQRAPAGGGTTYNIYGNIQGSNLALGNEIAGDLNQTSIANTLHIGANPDKAALLAGLRLLQAEIEKAHDLPEDKAGDLKDDLQSAIKAVDRPQPDKKRAADKLNSMQEIIDGLKGNVSSALVLGNLIAEALRGLG